jgi:hypothetical protein
VCVCVRVLSEKGLNELRTRQACARMWLKNPNSQYGFEGPLLSENSCILLGGWSCPFIDPRAQFTNLGSQAPTLYALRSFHRKPHQ